MGSILLSCGSLDYKTTNVLSYNPRVSCVLAHFFCLIRLIGQKTCYKTAIAIEISMAIAVLSFLKEDKGWTKNVFRMLVNS